ncbi:hypothetical protein L6V77_08635 [Myxococcota bacterium]|nr:hypothetical protein [Myxococcota bacterium]
MRAFALGLAGTVAVACRGGDGFVDRSIGGFRHPETVLHDPVGDTYLVSNINENPQGRDGNGFISRLSPNGRILARRFVDGARPGVELHAPKGMALSGAHLFVADLDVVRVFDRESGAPRGHLSPPGARTLNGMASGPDGAVYVTDPSWNEDATASTGSDTVFRIGLTPGTAPETWGVEVLCRGRALAQPNGIYVDASGIYLASWSTGEVSRLRPDCTRDVLGRVERGGNDGLVRRPDGGFFVSAWHARGVFSLDADGTTTRIYEHRAIPGIGWDAARRRLLVPYYELGRVGFRDVP